LDKAAELSYKTIQADPANPTYLDTYAWILFMQGKYTEAKIYIDETLKHLEETAENAGIIEHAGDIYIRLGHTQEAVSFWQRALKLGSESATLKKKINRKKYIAP
jgi:tetratricopeptide (TPR) repeat protein